MTYRLFLYKSAVSDKNAPAIDNVNIALKTNDAQLWKSNEVKKYILDFDVLKVKQEIEEIMCRDSDNPRCKVIIKKGFNTKVKYICVVTSYENAKDLINCSFNISLKYSLLLYDAQTDRCLDYSDIYDEKHVMVYSRAKELKSQIREVMTPVWRIRQIGYFDGKYKKVLDYCVTLKKDKNVSFEKRIVQFYKLLKSSVLGTEELVTDNRCFTIKTNQYQVSFTLEAYKKNADRIGFILNEKPCASLVGRMSCEKAHKWLQDNIKLSYFKYDYCMYVEEMKELYPNPADRFVNGVYIVKRLENEDFGIRYNCYYGGAVSFSPIIGRYYRDSVECSYLMIDDIDVGPILHVICEFYPYFSKRYNEDNYLPEEMMIDIIKKLTWVRNLIINDTFNDELKPYASKDCFFFLCRNVSEEDMLIFNENFFEFLYKYRYKAARIYDIFIKWAETQIEMHGGYGFGLMFNMTGP